MMSPSIPWPAPHDPAAADRLEERFAALGAGEARLLTQPGPRALLRCLGGNSPFLADLAVREALVLRRLLTVGPDAAAAAAMADLARVPPSSRRERVAAALRKAKRVIALTAAAADIGGLWTLEAVTGALSSLAEAALSLAVAHLLRAAHDRGELALPDPDRPAHQGAITVLGMGKLGARELNFSSDVDLVVLYDSASSIYTGRGEQDRGGQGALGPGGGGRDSLGGFMARLTRDMVTLMEARDADGYVFRTDLRLRPDPAATPPAIAVNAAITYYESMGQNWERAAMIKARPVAGDLALGAAFLEAIRPFVWRRGLDFAAVADIHAMKRRINQHRLSRGGARVPVTADPAARIAGHNVKLGEGGIREIEFLVQTLQLVWGGRDPGLRDPTTLGALRLLTRAGRIPRAAARELAEAYRVLRQIEHRLQMVADRQTHELPTKPGDLARIATFLGYADTAAFAVALIRQLTRVGRRYAEVFESVPDPLNGTATGPDLDFRGDDPAPAATIAALRDMGFVAGERIVAAVRGWQAGHVRAMRSARARELMGMMLPTILARLGAQPHQDEVFTRFDRFLAAQPAGVQLLSLFQRNPSLLDRIAAVLGAAPPLAEHLARYAAALDGLLVPEEDDAPRRLRALLKDADGLEAVIERTRRTVKEEDFAISVATMEGRLDADAAGERRTAMADAAMEALLGPVAADFAARFGHVRGGGMAVVAMGKAGGREMMTGSDLDLMLIYDHPDTVAESRGARTMPASQWFVRLAHAYVAALTAPGVEGPMYEVDMRLRPSGNKGPVAVPLAGFRRYHADSAWTWERMALTRARVVAGPAPLRARVTEAIEVAVAAAGDPDRIREDAAAMRMRMARELPPSGPWDVKQRPGGLIDVEFIAQVARLCHPGAAMGDACQTTRVALQRLAAAGAIDGDDAALLVRADHVWRTVQGMLRITMGRVARGDPPPAARLPLLHATGVAGVAADDLETLGVELERLAAQVRPVFTRLVGAVG